MLNWFYIENKLQKYDLCQALEIHHYNFLNKLYFFKYRWHDISGSVQNSLIANFFKLKFKCSGLKIALILKMKITSQDKKLVSF